jgi:hypothetical protein
MFFCAGAVVGAVGAKNIEKIKEHASPWLSKAAEAAGDAYSSAARSVAERLEAVHDAMAEAKQNGATSQAHEYAADLGPVAAAANGQQD